MASRAVPTANLGAVGGAAILACATLLGACGGTSSGSPGASSSSTPASAASPAWTALTPSAMAGGTAAGVVAHGIGFAAVGAAPDVGSGQQAGIWTAPGGTTWAGPAAGPPGAPPPRGGAARGGL